MAFQQFLFWSGIGVFAILILVIAIAIAVVVDILCFHFPRKCEKCGKLRAFISTRRDTATIFTAGWSMVSDHYISQKICINCGFEEKPKLIKKSERPIPD